VPYGPAIVEKKNNFGIIENEKGLSCSITHRIPQNINLVLGRENSIEIQVKKRKENPYDFIKEYTKEEIRDFSIMEVPLEVFMDIDVPYTLERAEIDIFDTLLK
ncbi:MAG TPA: hypothetical protein PLD54_05100, partial [Candidatus Levybacteria bacterium]|nr:hypothetical protein [Candidatus Levybacteria bacterium]